MATSLQPSRASKTMARRRARLTGAVRSRERMARGVTAQWIATWASTTSSVVACCILLPPSSG